MFPDQNLSKYQCGFRTCYSAQHYLEVMLEEWKDAGDNKKVFETFLINLFKALDYLSYKQTFAILHACDLSLPEVRLIHDFLSNRQPKLSILNNSGEEVILRVLLLLLLLLLLLFLSLNLTFTKLKSQLMSTSQESSRQTQIRNGLQIH